MRETRPRKLDFPFISILAEAEVQLRKKLKALNNGGGTDTFTFTNGTSYEVGIVIKQGDVTLHKTVKALKQHQEYLKQIWNVDSIRIN